ncbi:hypothetical protein B0H14DRAFT_625435 [Mycena olivaceomarginata]|nr:hypothetical protein B0H14DRAFT_625435 [Mycena olivaceomarginata]
MLGLKTLLRYRSFTILALMYLMQRLTSGVLGVDASAESNVFLPLGAGAVVEISTSSKEAAVLLLPDGASRVNLRPLKEFRDYAIKHAQCWYEFVNGNLRRYGRER